MTTKKVEHSRNNKSSTVKKEEFSIVCTTDSWGYNETSYFTIRDKFIESQPEFWEFLNPGTFLAYFLLANNGRERTNRLISELEELKNSSSLFNETGIGQSEGVVIVSYNKSGKVDCPPIGMASSNAMRSASKKNK